MDIPTKIRTACAALRISEAELARRIGTSPSAFHQRMNTGKFNSAELEAIADALGAEFVCYFQLPTGDRF
jgi:transcriptional regulator with XRE-family HTH domain